MDAWAYAGVSDEEFAEFVAKYRKLCAATPWIYTCLLAETVGKTVLLSVACEGLFGRPLAALAFAVAYVPFVTYFALTFCRLPPPIHPSTFQRLLFLAARWIALSTLAACVFVAIASVQKGMPFITAPLALSVVASACAVSVLLKHHHKLKHP